MKKRLLSMILAISMVLTFLPVSAITAFAEDAPKSGTCGADGDNLTWTLSDDGVLTISGTGAMADYTDDKSLSPWFDDFEYITQVTLGDNVTSIGDYAFSECYKLTEVTIPDNVTSIGDYAFSDCTGLTEVTIPEGVTTIADGTFFGCLSLIKAVIPDNVTSIGEEAFYDCEALISVEIPGSVKSIGKDAFFSCPEVTSFTVKNTTGPFSSDANGILYEDTAEGKVLRYYPPARKDAEVTIPNDVTSIGDYAFLYSMNLTEVKILNGVTSIGEGAFSNCEKLISVEIPNSVTSIGEGAFRMCTKLKDVTIPGSVTELGDEIFDNSGVKTINYEGTDETIINKLNALKPADATVQQAHTVTFNNGAVAEAQKVVVPYNETVKAPEAPAVKGYAVAGYFTDKDYDTEFKFDTEKITADKMVYVKWEKIPDQKLTVTSGTFTYKDGDKEIAGTTGVIPVGTSVTVTFDKDAFADSGSKFNYWDIDGLEDPNAYYKKESFTFEMPANEVKLTAMTQDATIDDPVAEVLGTTAMVTTAVAGTAVLAYTGYQLGSELYLIYLLPTGAEIPTNTAQLAKLVWTDAGKPAPAALLAEDVTEEQQAMAWAVENDLIDADKAADASVSRIEVIKTWKKAQSVKKG